MARQSSVTPLFAVGSDDCTTKTEATYSCRHRPRHPTLLAAHMRRENEAQVYREVDVTSVPTRLPHLLHLAMGCSHHRHGDSSKISVCQERFSESLVRFLLKGFVHFPAASMLEDPLPPSHRWNAVQVPKRVARMSPRTNMNRKPPAA